MSSKPRAIPSYFRDVEFKQWNIKTFLDATLHLATRSGKQYNHGKAVKVWRSSLEHYAKKGDELVELKEMAKSLLGKWDSRDKRRATKWFDLNQPTQRQNIKKTSTTTIGPAIIGTTTTIDGRPDFAGGDINTDASTSYGSNGSINLDTDGGTDDEIYLGNSTTTDEDIDNHDEITLPPQGFSFATTHRNLSKIIAKSAIPRGHLAREGVIDLDDHLVMELFEESEVLELKELIPENPKPDEHFVRSLRRFLGAKPSTFREILETVPYRDANVTYTREIHADAEWVNQVFMHMIRLYEHHRDLTNVVYKKAWLNLNIWSTLIDSCIVGRSELFLRRKEVQSLSLEWRSKQHKQHGTEPHSGNPRPKLDGIVYILDNPRLEFGAVEVSIDFKGTSTLEWRNDSNKLLTTLHTMAMRASDLVDHHEDTMKALQFVAFIHAGLDFRVYRLFMISQTQSICVPGGLRSIPTTLDDLEAIIKPMNSIHLAMRVLSQSAEKVKSYLQKHGRPLPNVDLESVLCASGF